ncbi:beta-ketoacyl-[acyl-carrier-protein] synthase family protein [Candidatus Omnitrophota bacterium]
MNQDKKRVVITGVGIISPVGIGKDAFWSALTKGTSGIKEIRSFDTADYSCKIGGEISDFDPDKIIAQLRTSFKQNSSTPPHTLDRVCQLGLAAAYLAIKDSSLQLATVNKQKAAVIMGTTSGTSNAFAAYHTTWLREGIKKVNPVDVAKNKHESIVHCISNEFGLKGISVLMGTACSAGTYAIGEAFDLLRLSKAEVILAGGADALSEVSHCGFNALRSLTKSVCRPFDKRRDGMVVSEGGAVVILETLEHAQKRNAHIYAEVVGYGLSCDAEHMTAPQANGESAANSMNMALKDAGITPERVDYISAHGTGTHLNDLMETNGIKRVFGEYAYKVPVSSVKSMVGHTFGAAGAIKIISCTLALQHNTLPPTINYQEQDPECDLDYVPNTARKKEINITLSNSFAFGGNNATLILRNYQ